MIRRNLKRFYKKVQTEAKGCGFAILLDGRGVKTPLKLDLIAPTQRLADLVAEEWHAQEEKILPNQMPITQLLNTALDRVPPQRTEMEKEILTYLESELICYFSDDEGEDDLKQKEQELWLPLIQWAKEELDIVLKTSSGIVHVKQNTSSFEAVQKKLDLMNDFQFTAFQQMVPMLGSLVISLALYKGHLDIDRAHRAAFLEQFFQCEKWGFDVDIQKKLDTVQKELRDTFIFLEAVNAT